MCRVWRAITPRRDIRPIATSWAYARILSDRFNIIRRTGGDEILSFTTKHTGCQSAGYIAMTIRFSINVKPDRRFCFIPGQGRDGNTWAKQRPSPRQHVDNSCLLALAMAVKATSLRSCRQCKPQQLKMENDTYAAAFNACANAQQ